jgi:hypothetical protein
LNFSLFYVIHGREPKLPADLAFRLKVERNELLNPATVDVKAWTKQAMDLRSHIEQLLSDQATARKMVAFAKSTNALAAAHSFAPGDKVLHWRTPPRQAASAESRSRKLIPSWTGPHTIVGQTVHGSPYAYKVKRDEQTTFISNHSFLRAVHHNVDVSQKKNSSLPAITSTVSESSAATSSSTTPPIV